MYTYLPIYIITCTHLAPKDLTQGFIAWDDMHAIAQIKQLYMKSLTKFQLELKNMYHFSDKAELFHVLSQILLPGAVD